MANKIKNKIQELAAEEFSDYLLPHIILNSAKEALVEGSKGIIEYNTAKVRLNCGRYIVCFSGADLSLRALNINETIISGDILSVEFCSL